MRHFLCLLGLHHPQITRRAFWGNCHRAVLHCSTCGKRYEAFTCGVRHGYVVAAKVPGDFWSAYDAGTLPQIVTTADGTRGFVPGMYVPPGSLDVGLDPDLDPTPPVIVGPRVQP